MIAIFIISYKESSKPLRSKLKELRRHEMESCSTGWDWSVYAIKMSLWHLEITLWCFVFHNQRVQCCCYIWEFKISSLIQKSINEDIKMRFKGVLKWLLLWEPTEYLYRVMLNNVDWDNANVCAWEGSLRLLQGLNNPRSVPIRQT